MSFFNNGSYKINYQLVPEAYSQNILFIHGNLSSNTWWKPTQEIWNKKNEKGSLIFAEWRGCGKSDGPRSIDDLSVESLAQDYINLLEHLNIKKAHIIGHSTGGIIALKALTMRHDLFEKVVLLDPVAPWGFQAPPELMAAFKQMQENKEFCSMIMGTTIYKNNPESELFKQIVEDAFNVHPLIWQGIPQVLSQVNFKNDLGKIYHPTLILHGEHDQILTKKDSEELVKLLPSCRYLELKNQGHSCNVENPELFVKLVQNFL